MATARRADPPAPASRDLAPPPEATRWVRLDRVPPAPDAPLPTRREAKIGSRIFTLDSGQRVEIPIGQPVAVPESVATALAARTPSGYAWAPPPDPPARPDDPRQPVATITPPADPPLPEADSSPPPAPPPQEG